MGLMGFRVLSYSKPETQNFSSSLQFLIFFNLLNEKSTSNPPPQYFLVF